MIDDDDDERKKERKMKRKHTKKAVPNSYSLWLSSNNSHHPSFHLLLSTC